MKHIPSGNLVRQWKILSLCTKISAKACLDCPLPCYQNGTKRLKQNPDLKYLSMFSYNATSAHAANPLGHGGVSNSSDPINHGWISDEPMPCADESPWYFRGVDARWLADQPTGWTEFSEDLGVQYPSNGLMMYFTYPLVN